MSLRNTPSILVVEDDPDTAVLLCESLADHFGRDCTKHIETMQQAQRIDLDHYDLALCDLNLRDGSGLDLLPQWLQQREDLPVVMVTSEAGMDTAMKAIRLGAYDYVVKIGDYLFTIPLIVEKNMEVWRTKQENLRLQEELKHTLEQVRIKNQQLEEAVRKLEDLASTDPLTGLANRRTIQNALEQSFAESLRYGADLTALMIDLDGFKQLNDSLGHQMGDKLLQTAARVLQANCRRSDIAGRYGGDEFVVLMPHTGPQTCQQVARRIQHEFATTTRAMELGGKMCTMSMGLSSVSVARPANADQLIAQADAALYSAKKTGKARIVTHQLDTAAEAPNPMI